jgi:MoxR-like ATPase
MNLPEVAERGHAVLDEIERVVVGKRDALELVLLGILAGGHVLVEDLPGTGKTLIARAFAAVLGLRFARVQFTPDLLPADVTGAMYLDPREGSLAFRPGPIFAHLVLADEINRAPAKTQAAMLEAMAERQVTADGVTRPLPAPFVVLATDNPIESEGVYPLPEAQLDRFVARARIGYLTADDEIEMLARAAAGDTDVARLTPLADPATVLAMRAATERVEVSRPVLAYVVELLAATRAQPRLSVGAGPRGGLALLRLARGRALLAGRDYVLPDDVKAVAVPALAHRLVLRPETWARGIATEQVVAEVLDTVPVPGGPGALEVPDAPAAGVR